MIYRSILYRIVEAESNEFMVQVKWSHQPDACYQTSIGPTDEQTYFKTLEEAEVKLNELRTEQELYDTKQTLGHKRERVKRVIP